MIKIKLKDIAHCFGNTFETIRDKYNRIDDMGVNHGRAIYYDRENDLYYKILCHEKKAFIFIYYL